MKAIILFSLPLIAGNLFQQLYNLVDTLVVGKFIGANALAAVGSSYMTMNFLTSIIIGLCMGSGVIFSYFYSAKDKEQLSQSFFQAFLFICGVTVVINGLSFLFIDEILRLLHIEKGIFEMTKDYLFIIFAGMFFVFLYNYFAAVLRSMGNSFIPLVFLIISSLLNIVLDYLFVVPFQMGVQGAGYATVIAQIVSAVGIAVYTMKCVPEMKFRREMFVVKKGLLKKIVDQSAMTSLVFLFAPQLMGCFVSAGDTGVIAEGVRYLRIVCPFYCLIGFLFMFYGLYRGMGKPQMSIVLTVISLGTRVALAYILSDIQWISVVGIWWAIPIGWFLADFAGFIYYRKCRKSL